VKHQKTISLILFALVVLLAPPVLPVHAQSISKVYVDPVKTNGPVYTPGSRNNITVSVWLDLAAGEMINGIDIELNYTNPHAYPFTTQVLQGGNTSYANNLFGSSGVVVTECVDGIPVGNTQGDCASGVGQVHFTEFDSSFVYGGQSHLLLFSQNFTVVGNGTSLFSIAFARLANPGSGQFSQSSLVEDYSLAAVFGNSGIVAFFDYWPTTLYPVVLPGALVHFNASNSFNTGNVALSTYSWDFGDGNTGTGVVPPDHVYQVSGNYSVQLTVTDTNGNKGIVTRVVDVVSGLSTLLVLVKSINANPIGTGVFAELSTSNRSFVSTLQVPSAVHQVTFLSLKPGTYNLKIYGGNVENLTRSETIPAGLQVLDTAYVTVDLPPPLPPNYSDLIFIASLLLGIGLMLALIAYKLVKQRRRDSTTATKSSLRNGGKPR